MNSTVNTASLLNTLTFWVPVDAVCATRLGLQKCYVLPTECICVSCVDLSKSQRLVTYTALMDWFFTAETDCVYRAVRIESLNIIHVHFRFQRAVPRLRRLVAGLLLRRPWFDPRSVSVRFVVDKVALVQVFLQVLRFYVSGSFHQCSVHIFSYTLPLPERQTGEAWQPSPKRRLSSGYRGALDRKDFHFSFCIWRSVRRLRLMVVGLSPRMSGFDSRIFRVRLWWTMCHWDRVFSDYFGLPLSLSFHECSIPIFIFILLLPEGQTCEAWEKYFNLFPSFKV
jgi:hypothetical protein